MLKDFILSIEIKIDLKRWHKKVGKRQQNNDYKTVFAQWYSATETTESQAMIKASSGLKKSKRETTKKFCGFTIWIL